MAQQTPIPIANSLPFRIAIQLFGVVVAALLLSAYLNYSNFDKTQRQLAESRILVSIGDVKRAVSGALDLGLSLEEVSNLGEILQRGLESGMSAGVQDLSVLNNKGALIASSSLQPADWRGVETWPIERQQKETVRSLATDRFAIGIPLMNAFGEKTGWLIVAYDGIKQLQARQKMREETISNLLLAIALAFVVLSAGVYWLTRSFINGLAMIFALKKLNSSPMDSQLVDLGVDYERFTTETDALFGSLPTVASHDAEGKSHAS